MALPRTVGFMVKPGRAIVIAYGAPAIAALVYMTCWPVGFHTILTRNLLVRLDGPLWTYPFHDLGAVLISIACARQGVDVTLPSDGCMGGGLFQYSPLLLKAAALPIGPAWRVPLGLGMDVAFLLSLYALPRPRCWGEFWCLLLAALSLSTLWALQTANLDIALYLLVLLAAHLLLRGAGMRAAGYAAILIAAAIKFYPACLMLLAARERLARFVPIALAALAGAVLFIIVFAGQLGHILPRLPQDGPFSPMFGATNLPEGLAMLLTGDDPDSTFGRAIRFASMTGLIGLCAMNTWHWMPTLLPALRALAPRPRMLLLAGAIAMSFCFLAAQNAMYRQIFLLLTLPGLWDLARDAPQPALRGRCSLAVWVVVGVMWSFYLQTLSATAQPYVFPGQSAVIVHLVIWIVRESLWWWLIGLFAAVILGFLWDSPVLGHWRGRRRTRSAGRPRLRVGAGD